MKNDISQRGFIALISTIIICAVLLALMAGADIGSFYARTDAVGMENKDAARALAASCVNVALLALALATSTDPAHYAPTSQAVQIGTDAWGNTMSCVIKDAIHTGATVTIDAYASSGDSFADVSTVASLPPDIQIRSWRDAP